MFVDGGVTSPSYLNASNVQHWSKHAKLLSSTQKSKALKFLEYDCVKYIGLDEEFKSKYTFVVLPLNQESEVFVPVRSGGLVDYSEVFEMGLGVPENFVRLFKRSYPVFYNKSVYKVYKGVIGGFVCNCQAWSMYRRGVDEGVKDDREFGCYCAHVLAVLYWLKIRNFNKN